MIKLLTILKEIGNLSLFQAYPFSSFEETRYDYGDFNDNGKPKEVFTIKCHFQDENNNQINVEFVGPDVLEPYLKRPGKEGEFALVYSYNGKFGGFKSDKDKTSTNNYFKILSTIVKITEKFIEKYNPITIIIVSDKFNSDPKIDSQKNKIYKYLINKNISSSYSLQIDSENNLLIVKNNKYINTNRKLDENFDKKQFFIQKALKKHSDKIANDPKFAIKPQQNNKKEVKNIDYYQQILNQSRLTSQSRNYIQSIINSIKKSSNFASSNQLSILQKFRTGGLQ